MEFNYEGLSKLRQLMLIIQDGIDRGLIRQDSGFHPEELPKGAEFNMSYPLHKYKCGTVACAGGWAKLVGICGRDDDWGLMVELGEQTLKGRSAQAWIFSGYWAHVAPAPRDVVRRIDHLVARKDSFVLESRYVCIPSIHSLWESIKNNPIDVVPACLQGYPLELTLEQLLNLAKGENG